MCSMSDCRRVCSVHCIRHVRVHATFLRPRATTSSGTTWTRTGFIRGCGDRPVWPKQNHFPLHVVGIFCLNERESGASTQTQVPTHGLPAPRPAKLTGPTSCWSVTLSAIFKFGWINRLHDRKDPGPLDGAQSRATAHTVTVIRGVPEPRRGSRRLSAVKPVVEQQFVVLLPSVEVLEEPGLPRLSWRI